MPLEKTQAEWLFRFTCGGIPLPQPVPPQGGQPPDPNAQRRESQTALLEVLRAREWAEEKALKAVLLAKAFAVIDQHKEQMRKNFDLQVQTFDDEQEKAKGEKGKKTTQDVRDEKGRQERAYDAKESTRVDTVGNKVDSKLTATDATQSMAILVEQKNRLESQMTPRSHLVDKTWDIVQKSERLFDDAEIMNELYTPLVRDLVVPETFVPDKFSATQKMIDGSDDYYIKECKSKGKPMPTGGAALAKGLVNVSSQIVTTVLGGVGSAGTMTKEMAARATDITNGIAATLGFVVDAVDQIDDLRKTGDFSSAGYQTVMNGLALGLGKIVAGSTGNMGLGLVITDSISGAVSLSAIAGEIAVWKKKGGEFPIEALFTLVGDTLAKGLSAASDQTSDTAKDANGNEVKTMMSTQFAQASQAATQIYAVAGRAAKADLAGDIKAGKWGSVFDFIKSSAADVVKQLPAQIKLDETFNAQGDYKDQLRVLTNMDVTSTGVEKMTGGANKLLGQVKGPEVPKTPEEKRMAEIEERFKAKQKELDQKAVADAKEEIAAIEKQMAAEKKAYTDSLLCLGSKEPNEAEFKSIAKLVEQLERDRAIWDGLTALFGGGIGGATGLAVAMGVAAEVAAPLKAAGQLVKYCVNLKAAADRCAAWLDWREGRKDAESAVSPYATSIDNFCRNQGQQFTHYSIQAAANAIQALLACGEMSPLAPAFKAAGGGVAAAAAAEDLLYQFYKKQALARAWKTTKEALDPKNRGNRKMALLARQVNPTLAKYTVAYGALVEQSPIAITMCNRIGIDRETLARSSDKVSDLKGYLEKLYPDDGTVVGVLDVEPGKTKVPTVALTSKAWALTYLVWSEQKDLATPNPPVIVANLAIVESLTAEKDLDEAGIERLEMALVKLASGFASFEPKSKFGAPIEDLRPVVVAYAELAEARAMAVRMEAGATADA